MISGDLSLINADLAKPTRPNTRIRDSGSYLGESIAPGTPQVPYGPPSALPPDTQYCPSWCIAGVSISSHPRKKAPEDTEPSPPCRDGRGVLARPWGGPQGCAVPKPRRAVAEALRGNADKQLWGGQR